MSLSISISTLPALGAALHGGIFAGLTTRKDGSHCAVVLLPDQVASITWKKAVNWAQKLEAELPSRPVAALLFANVKDRLRPAWHWTSVRLWIGKKGTVSGKVGPKAWDVTFDAKVAKPITGKAAEAVQSFHVTELEVVE